MAKSYTTSKTIEHTDALPMTISANGSVLADYRVYGSAGDVGEEVDITGLSEPLCGIGAYTDSLDLSTGALARRIKKFVVTGEENWMVRAGQPSNIYFIEFYSTNFIQNKALCTHYINQESGSFNQTEDKHCLVALSSDGIRLYIGIRDSSYNSTPAFISYLKGQYAAGTPVIVWYVLAETETETIPVPSGLTGTLEGYLIQDGTPTPQTPIYPTANGVKQADDTYSIKYGYKLDMSVQSANLFDPSDTTPNYRYDDNGNWVKDTGVLSSGLMKIAAGDKYEYKFKTVTAKNDGICRINFLNANGQWLSVKKVSFKTEVGDVVTVSGTAPAGTASIRTSQFNGELDISMTVVADTTPIYIGDTPLGEDEYVDYGEQKVYRRPNLYDANATDTSKGYLSNSYLYGNTIGSNLNWFVSEYMPILADTDYIASGLVDVGALGVIATINVYDSNKQIISYETVDSSGNTEINSGVNGAFIRISARNEHKNTVVVKPKNATPTDPPVPLPTLPTCDGTTIIDCDGTPKPSQMYVKYNSWSGWESCAVKRYHKSKNLLEITQDMYNSDTWIVSSTNDFMYYALPQNVIDVLKNAETVAGTAYLKTGGEYYSGEVFAITPQMSMTVSTEYYLLLNDGTSLNFSQNVSNWDDIYLCIGYGSKIKPANKQRLINSLFHNFNIMLNEGTTALPYEPYGSWWEDGTEYVRRNGVWVQ